MSVIRNESKEAGCLETLCAMPGSASNLCLTPVLVNDVLLLTICVQDVFHSGTWHMRHVSVWLQPSQACDVSDQDECKSQVVLKSCDFL
jgi:hypothetical protein